MVALDLATDLNLMLAEAMNNLFQVDAFTSEAFKGNPAAVYFSEGPKEVRWMQNLAIEMNLSETAFVHPVEKGFSLRWFTPTNEIDLCGHATLASAHTLWSQGLFDPENEIRFHTRSGELIAKNLGEKIQLDFPAIATSEVTDKKSLIEESLREKILKLYRGGDFFVAELENRVQINSLNPNFDFMNKNEIIGVIATTRGAKDAYDFVSRVFVPGHGIDEDPVTGAAHCALATYWSAKLNKKEFLAYQASKRGGELGVRLEGERVFLSGSAVTVFAGVCFA